MVSRFLIFSCFLYLFVQLNQIHGKFVLNACTKFSIPDFGYKIPESISKHLDSIEKLSSFNDTTSTSTSSITFNKIDLKCTHPTEDKILIVYNNNSTYSFSSNGIFKGPVLLPSGYSLTNAYCIQRLEDEWIELNVCFIDCLHSATPCIPKCCSKNQAFNIDTEECEENLGSDSSRGPHVFHQMLNETTSNENDQILTDFLPHFIKKLEFCTLASTPLEVELFGLNVRLLHNGTLEHSADGESWEPYYTELFCLDSIADSNNTILIDLNCSYDGSVSKHYDKLLGQEEIQAIASFIHALLMILCSIFLIGTLVIYGLLWDKQNIHGWTVVSYIVSLLCLYILLTVSKFMVSSNSMELNSNRRSIGCWINGVLAHFTFLSTFAWLTVINFDIWWKFRNMNPHPMRSKEVIRYLSYGFFALGLPLLIVTIGLILEDFERTASIISKKPQVCLMKNQISKGPITPKFGCNCFVQPKALGVYIYYPISVLICCNCYFFLTTAHKIYQHYKSTKQARSCKAEQELESLKTICKLFVVMGITWIFELLSFEFNSKKSIVEMVIWSILDAANLLQSLGIFFIFVWKRQILTQLWQKYPSFRPILQLFKVLPGCKKRKLDYQSSSKMTRKTTRRRDGEDSEQRGRCASASIKSRSWDISKGRKLSDTSGTTIIESNIDL